ncbi:UDP-glucoronosyl and UDP-glucosyl transferase, partial [Musa troglodytarum]
MLRLARRLAARGLLVTVVLTEEWLSLLSDSFPPPLPAAVRLRTIPDVVPSERGRGADFASFIRSVLVRMGGPVAALLAELDPPPDAIIADSMLPWAPLIAHRMGVPVAAFFPQAANVFLAFQELKTLAAGRPQRSELYQTGTETTRNRDGFLDRLPKAASGHLADFITHSAGEGMLKAFMDGIAWFSSARLLCTLREDDPEEPASNNSADEWAYPIDASDSITFRQIKAITMIFDDVATVDLTLE